jgi:hypothetical protein
LFGQDLFGVQFGICDNEDVVTFNPEIREPDENQDPQDADDAVRRGPGCFIGATGSFGQGPYSAVKLERRSTNPTKGRKYHRIGPKSVLIPGRDLVSLAITCNRMAKFARTKSTTADPMLAAAMSTPGWSARLPESSRRCSPGQTQTASPQSAAISTAIHALSDNRAPDASILPEDSDAAAHTLPGSAAQRQAPGAGHAALAHVEQRGVSAADVHLHWRDPVNGSDTPTSSAYQHRTADRGTDRGDQP